LTTANASIRKSVTNGPYVYDFNVNGVVQTVVTGQTVAASINAVRDLVAALPGNILTVRISVSTDA
jgi:hypothetical protein